MAKILAPAMVSVRKHPREVEHKRSENILVMGGMTISLLTLYGMYKIMSPTLTQADLFQYTTITNLVFVMTGLVGLVFLNRIHESLIVIEEKLDR